MGDIINKYAKDIYNSLPREGQSLFPGKVTQMNAFLHEMCGVLFPGIPISNLKLEQVNFCIKLYIDTYTRKTLFKLPTEEIKKRLGAKYGNFPKATISQAVEISVAYIYHNNPEIKKMDQIIEEREKAVAKNAELNKSITDIHINDPQYGLVPEKPVFTAGFKGQDSYMRRLRSKEDVGISYKRLGSTQVSGISGPIDIFNISFEDGRPNQLVYICLYAFENSKVAPRGFKLS